MTSIGTSGSTLQVNSTHSLMNGKNIINSDCLKGKVVFDESYIVVGDISQVSEIYACYGLTIIGNIDAKKITSNGDLFINGNINCSEIICNRSLVCTGEVMTENLYVSNSATLESLHTTRLFCGDNLIVQTTADVSENCENSGVFIAGEGIIGSGSFSSKNTIAIEYFDFDGEVKGNVLEVDTGVKMGTSDRVQADESSLHQLLVKVRKKVKDQLKTIEDQDEDVLLRMMTELKDTELSALFDIDMVLNKIIELSYLSKIDNFRDYLLILLAKKKMPEQLRNYETIEGVFSILLPHAEEHLGELTFRPSSIEDIAMGIEAIVMCRDDIKIDAWEAADKVFSSVGLRYGTVERAIKEGNK